MLEKVSKDILFSLPALLLVLIFGGWWIGRLWTNLVQADELTALKVMVNWPVHAEAGQSGIISL
ncbi:MAG: hypothetical protein Q4G02_00850 [bacterium]|nr:hypothetical protein [bacterium]